MPFEGLLGQRSVNVATHIFAFDTEPEFTLFAGNLTEQGKS